MKFKQPEFLNVEIKNARGLAAFQDIYALRLNTLPVRAILDTMKVIVPLATGEASLRPGEETSIVVPLTDLPLNANVTKITGTLAIQTGREPQPIEDITVGIEEVGQPPKKTYHLNMEVPIRPRSIALRLSQGDVFWTSTGMPPKDSYVLPDFAEQVNAYLDRVKPENNRINLRFLVKSDISGTAEIKIYAHEYSQLQTQIWENPLDETIRFDRNFQLEFSATERIPLEPIVDSVNRNVIKLDVGGELEQERLLGSVEEHDGKELVTVSNDYSVAQKVELETPVQCVGICGLFQTETEAELYIEIQDDRDGFPATETPLTKTNLSLTSTEKNGDPAWSFVNFETPIDLRADTPYWILVKGVQGNIQLGLQTDRGKASFKITEQSLKNLKPEGVPNGILGRLESIMGQVFRGEKEFLDVLETTIDEEQTVGEEQTDNYKSAILEHAWKGYLQLFVNRGGQLWKSIAPVSDPGIVTGLLRLVYLPEIDNQTAAVEIGIEEAQLYQHLDPGPQAQTIAFDVGNLNKVSIVVKSHAQGTLSIANVIQEYSSG